MGMLIVTKKKTKQIKQIIKQNGKYKHITTHAIVTKMYLTWRKIYNTLEPGPLINFY